MTTITEKAELLHALHRRGEPLILANAWDVASARLVEEAGAKAVATTSAGVAWSLGAADGDRLGVEAAVALVARVAAAVSVPVTADIENGFAQTPSGVASTIRAVLAAGAVGVNLEDAVYLESGVRLRDTAQQAERIAAAREAAAAAGVNLFINARIDTYLLAVGGPAEQLDATVARAAAFVAAGASGVFVPGVVDPATISALVSAIDAPLNILAGPSAPPIPELAALGVARISLGSSIAAAAYALVSRAAREAFGEGTYTEIGQALGYGQLNEIIAGD
ncbi:MAG TPA: isocitrate lyase/phosphoenolpyruvate mutase family protein [Actinocrinis sp.]|uniref:isocitrate lyase/PEP mutase family protein n=1 Tax=Actinocrinis sp. TaxID=1920516 RepID=UPI002DDC9082|nr:isocitrate lyase/phosphoenolpyruvate mutase family protein [Actinocrinis sp.]HEV2343099.1 isocitrate lyase/phosphoenolpyruvate mutase family protein [Actinocrinis sp.]